MTRVALDTNVLVYAELEPDTPKGARARQAALNAASDGVICVQVFSEFLRVVQRADPTRIDRVLALIGAYLKSFAAPATSTDVLKEAAAIARDHKLQVLDAIIVAASASAGATVLLSEDMQDGRAIGGLRIINPFDPANAAAVDALFPA